MKKRLSIQAFVCRLFGSPIAKLLASVIHCLVTIFVLEVALLTQSTCAATEKWTRQIGTDRNEWSIGVSTDGYGNAYITGWTEGSLGKSNLGGIDAFINKFDSSGVLLWADQFGTSRSDRGYDVSTDSLGNVYVTGSTGGSLEGESGGTSDAFLRKYNSNGNDIWTTQLGSDNYDSGTAVTTDGLGNVYIAGETESSLGGPSSGNRDAFVSKYTSDGDFRWTEQFGTSDYDDAFGIASDILGNVYVSGHTRGSLEGTNLGYGDAFVSKFDSDGGLLWTNQFGTSGYDRSFGVSADSLGNVYVSGWAEGSIDGTKAFEGRNAFLSSLDTSGTISWTKQLNTKSNGVVRVSADGLGNAYISGSTGVGLDGSNIESRDAFVSKYDSSGTLLGAAQLGTNTFDRSFDVSADGLGNVYISGFTYGSLSGVNAGASDVIVSKWTEIPEPTTWFMLLIGAAISILHRPLPQRDRSWDAQAVSRRKNITSAHQD